MLTLPLIKFVIFVPFFLPKMVNEIYRGFDEKNGDKTGYAPFELLHLIGEFIVDQFGGGPVLFFFLILGLQKTNKIEKKNC